MKARTTRVFFVLSNYTKTKFCIVGGIAARAVPGRGGGCAVIFRCTKSPKSHQAAKLLSCDIALSL